MLRLFILAMFLSATIEGFAQTSYKGVSAIGVDNNRLAAYKSKGLVAAYIANRGIGLMGTTNVFYWGDASGNGNAMYQWTVGNNPTFIADYSTNHFPTVFFSGIGNNILQNNTIAPLFSGVAKPYTIITLFNSDTNASGIGPLIASFGWLTASNANASILGLRCNGSTLANANLIQSYDTNASPGSISRSGSATNCFIYLTGTSDGISFQRLFVNLTASGALAVDTVTPRTANTFTLGGLVRTNAGITSLYRGGLTATFVFTNGFTGTDVTNTVNDLNSIWKVF